jgi:hypothetical protein
LERDRPLYWFHNEDRFCFREGPLTRYDTKEEAEGAILWIMARKGFESYFGLLRVVEIDAT